MADGTTYEIGIVADGSQATAAAGSLDTFAAAMDRAKAASSAASAAMTAGQAAYDAAEVKANRAALAVERIGVAGLAAQGKLAAALDAGDAAGIEAATAKLDALRAKSEEATAASSEASAALAAQAATLDGLKASAGQAAAEEKQVADAMKGTTSAGEGGGASLRSLSSAFGRLGGPAGMAGQKLAGLGNAFQKLAALGPAGIVVGIAVAAVAVVAGLAMGAFALLKFGVASADAARTQALLSAGIAGSVEGGAQLEATIGSLADRVPIATDELRTMATSLAKTGLKGAELTAALETAAEKAARLKFGPEFGKAMLGLDQQSARLKRNVSAIFGGLKIDRFLEALSTIGDLFDSNSGSAKALKVVFESFFQPAIDGATDFIPAVVGAILQVEIWAMKGLIALKPYGFVFRGIADAALGFGQMVAFTFGAIFSGAALGIEGLSALGAAGSTALGALSGAALKVREFLLGFSLTDIGLAMLDGLALGIVSGGPKAIAAIMGVAGGAITAAKKALGIASPSKVFGEIGGYTAEGFSRGVDEGAVDAQASLTSLVAPPAVPTSGAPSSSGMGGGGNTITITINANGDAESIGEAVRRVLLDVLEGDARQIGASA